MVALACDRPATAGHITHVESDYYFSILQRKALTPNDLQTVSAVRERIHQFEREFNQEPVIFNWGYTRSDLERRLKKAA